MEFNSKDFRRIVALMAIGAFGTACAPVPGALPPTDGQATKQLASKNRTSLVQPGPVSAQPKDGTAFYPTSDSALRQTRATLVPPKQEIPEYRIAAANTATESGASPTLFKPQAGSKPARGYQSGRSATEERNSFDGVDVASATDTGSNDNDSAGGGGNVTASDPVSGSNRSSGGGSSSAARSR
jgi:hypothetical protein